MFTDETFEYLTKGITNPSNEQFQPLDYDSHEYKVLEHAREYFNLLLNELGAVGWELITMYDNSYERAGKNFIKVDTLIFKRSSRSNHFGKGLGVDVVWVSDKAKEIAEQNHPDFNSSANT